MEAKRERNETMTESAMDRMTRSLEDRAARSAEALRIATEENERLHRELAIFEKWDAAERAKGRPASDLTWGNCVRECGLLVEKGDISG